MKVEGRGNLTFCGYVKESRGVYVTCEADEAVFVNPSQEAYCEVDLIRNALESREGLGRSKLVAFEAAVRLVLGPGWA